MLYSTPSGTHTSLATAYEEEYLRTGDIRYKIEADKIRKKQHSLGSKLFALPLLPVAMLVQAISGNNPMNAVKSILK